MRYIDEEWDEAKKVNEDEKYYKCKMLNGGYCYKKYKPFLAKLVLKRGVFLEMIKIE